VFLLCEPSFCHCCKVGWKLVSGAWEHMNYQKKVFSNCVDVLNPNMKSLLPLVEWKIIKHKTLCFCFVNHLFVTAVKLVGNLFLMCKSIWCTEREYFPSVLVCRIQISNNFCFWLSGRSSKIKQYVFLLCETSCCHCCKVGWKLISSVWEHFNDWNRGFSNCFDVLNPNIRLFLLLVEWKIIKYKTICVFVMWNIILSLL